MPVANAAPGASLGCMRSFPAFTAALLLGACAQLAMQDAAPEQPVEAAQPVPEALDPTPAPSPPAAARTVEEFDTTTAEDRAEAVAAPETAGIGLGTTLATLGSPTDPGIWLKTPLVDAVTPGRVEYLGRSANVELRPSGGAPGSGSQISLAAMRLLEAPLTEVIEVTVSAR